MTPEQEKQALEAFLIDKQFATDWTAQMLEWRKDEISYDWRLWCRSWEARGRTSGQHVSEQFRNLHECANAVVAEIGAHGEISSGHRYTERLLDAVYACDPLLASGQQGVEGYKLVPVEPTDKMLSVFANVKVSSSAIPGGVCAADAGSLYSVWKAMLAASPQITSPAEDITSQPWSKERDFLDSIRAAQPSDSVQEPVLYMSRDGDTCTSELWKAADSRTRDWYCRRLYELPEPPGGT